jgi:hypothetical protein
MGGLFFEQTQHNYPSPQQSYLSYSAQGAYFRIQKWTPILSAYSSFRQKILAFLPNGKPYYRLV